MGVAEDALTVKCPLCGAAKDQPCTYLSPKPFVPREGQDYPSWYKGPVRQGLNERAGTPTKVPHLERRNHYYGLQRQAQMRAINRRISKNPSEAALFALRDFDRAELEREKEWLRNWGWIFWSDARPPDWKQPTRGYLSLRGW